MNMLRSRYGNEFDTPHLDDNFLPTLGMISDPKIKFFLQNLQPAKIIEREGFGEKTLGLEKLEMIFSDDFDFDSINIPEKYVGSDLYVLPIIPENLTRKILFPSKQEKKSTLRGKIVRKVGDGYETVYTPTGDFFFSAAHFIKPELYTEFIEGIRKEAYIPYDITTTIREQTSQALS